MMAAIALRCRSAQHSLDYCNMDTKKPCASCTPPTNVSDLQEDNGLSPKLLSGLPADAIIHVMSFLHPQDILALRKVCRSLSAASHQRTVWMDALLRVSAEHDVFTPSYPIQEMNIQQLIHAATAPARFTGRLIRELPANPVTPFLTRILSNPDLTSDTFTIIHLVPGGRFFVASSDNILRIWDLGNGTDSMINANPISSVTIDGVFRIAGILIRGTTDGHGISILIMSNVVHGKLQFDIVEIYPESLDPSFRRVANLVHTYFWGGSITLFSADHVGFGLGDWVFLWNFVQDTWVRWGTRHGVVGAILCDDMVLLSFGREFEILITKIPLLHPRIPGSQPHIETLNILMRTGPLVKGRHKSITITGNRRSAREMTADLLPIHFDLFSSDDQHDTFITHYSLRPINNNAEDGHPSCLPVCIGRTSANNMTSVGIYSPQSTWPPADCVQYFWLEGGVLNVNVTTSLSTEIFSFTPVSGTLSTPSNPLTFCVCPFSGRICVLMDTPAGFEVQVLDYIGPGIEYMDGKTSPGAVW